MKSLIRHFISDPYNKKENSITSILNAMHLTSSAWKNVGHRQIRIALENVGFLQDQTTSSMNESNFESM